jgi:hypothetical protein
VIRAALAGVVGITAVLGCVPAMADVQSCDDFGGTVDAGRTCHAQTGGPGYLIGLSFPVDYPDLQPLLGYLARERDQFVDYAHSFPPRDRPGPYQLVVRSTAYRSGSADDGTQSVVLFVGQDVGVHPVASVKTFNYDLARHRPITFDTLFKPGAIDVIAPAVRRELASTAVGLPPMRGGLDPATYQNFAITDDAVTFYFDQDQLFGQNEGPLHAAVPRAELAAVVA